MARMGRPPLPESERLGEPLYLRLRSTQDAFLEEVRRLNPNATTSQILRTLIDRGMKTGVEELSAIIEEEDES